MKYKKRKIVVSKKKKKINYSVILGILAFAAGVFLYSFFSQNSYLFENEEEVYLGEDTQIVTHDFFSFEKPVSWQEIELGDSSYVYFKDSEGAGEVLSVVVSRLDSGQDIDDLIDFGIESSKTIMPDLKITERRNQRFGDDVGVLLRFKGNIEGENREYNQITLLKDNKLYTVTYSCILGDCNSYGVFSVARTSFEFN
jgi:hypothetical protein